MNRHKHHNEETSNKIFRNVSAQEAHEKRIARNRARAPKYDVLNKTIHDLKAQYKQIKAAEIKAFTDFPLSTNTQQGLAEAKFETPTEIQQQTIGLALQGHDVLGAAKTGSGKTLAFIIPILEMLFRNKVSAPDSMHALIISPTRELAYQTVNVLRKVGKHHDFSSGLVIGGIRIEKEAAVIAKTHIVIATPGRLLQHMEQTYTFNCDSLRILVLDECDRMLDLGFKDTMNAIFEYFPKKRQTLMFSATQTKNVDDLVRVGLSNPVYVSVHEKAQIVTPEALEQNYIDVELKEKLNTLWFFIRNHLKSKILVFMHTCKQVRFVATAFSKLRSGIPIRALYARLNQLKRVQVYEEFCRKEHVVLIATDIASRGLDFPGVDWVVQVDAPENVETYIHRVGRTARYQSVGQSLLFLMPSEKKEMLRLLAEKNLSAYRLQVDPKKVGKIRNALASLLSEDIELKEFAKGAFLHYMKGICMMKNKALFNVSALDHKSFALSLGLVIIPRIRFIEKREKEKLEKEKKEELRRIQIEATAKRKEKQEAQRKENLVLSNSSDDSSSDDSSDDSSSDDSSSDDSSSDDSSSDNSDSSKQIDDFLKLKDDTKEKKVGPDPGLLKAQVQKDLEFKAERTKRPQSKKDLAKAMKRHGIKSQHIKFAAEESSEASEAEDDEENKFDIEKARQRLQAAEQDDKQTHRRRVREMYIQQKAKQLRAAFSQRKDDGEDSDEEPEVILGRPSDQSESDVEDDDQPRNDYEDSDQSDDQKNATMNESGSEEEAEDPSEEDESVESESEPASESGYETAPKRRKRSISSSIRGSSGTNGDQRLADNTIDEDEQFALRLLQR